MKLLCFASAFLAGCFLCALTACGARGDGDIGPKLVRLPDASYRLLVRDDAGRAVVNAAATLSGFEASPAWSNGQGRVDFYFAPVGRLLVTIDASNALATPGDELGTLAFAADVGGAQALVAVVHLADFATSSGLALSAGVQGSASTLDDTTNSGAVLSISAGTTITFGSAAQATLRTASLRPDHLPPLRRTDGAPALATRGIQIAPSGATFAPGIDLSMPNDIGLRPGQRADLYELDPTSGEWRAIGQGEADATATTIRTLAPVVSRATLLSFCVAAPAVATFTGHLIQRDTIRGLDLGRVRAAQIAALCNSDGRFTLGDVPIALADGTPIMPRLSISGGRRQRPGLVERDLDPAHPDLGDVEVDIEGVVDLRSLVISRGKRFPFTAVNIGSVGIATGAVTVADSDARVDFPGLSDRYIGFLSTTLDPTSVLRVLTLDGRSFLREGKRNIDQSLFFGSETWLTNARGGTLIVPVDPQGGGRLAAAKVFRRVATEDRYRETTREQFETREDVGNGVEIAVTLVTEAGVRRQFSACSVMDVIVGRAELPLPRARRADPGEFEPYGILEGDFRIPFGPQLGPNPAYAVSATEIENADHWLDVVLANGSTSPRTPIFLDPERDGGTEFRRGMPTRGGHVAALRGEISAGRFEIGSMFFDTEQRYPPGSVSVLPTSGIGEIGFDTDFIVQHALAGLDAAITADSLRSDIAMLLPDGRAVQIARDHDGNLTAAGDSASFRLPAVLVTSAGSSRWLAVLSGRAEVAGVWRQQRGIFDMSAPNSQSEGMLAVPRIHSPAPGAIVPLPSFTVEFAVPVGTSYTVVRLHGENGDDTRDWLAILPPDATSFTFRQLPETTVDAQVLASGAYTLEIEAARISGGRALQQGYPPFQAVAARFVGIGTFERQVDALSSVRIQIQVQ